MPTIPQITLSTQDIATGAEPKKEPMKSAPINPIIPNLIAAATTNTSVTVLSLNHFLRLSYLG